MSIRLTLFKNMFIFHMDSSNSKLLLLLTLPICRVFPVSGLRVFPVSGLDMDKAIYFFSSIRQVLSMSRPDTSTGLTLQLASTA